MVKLVKLVQLLVWTVVLTIIVLLFPQFWPHLSNEPVVIVVRGAHHLFIYIYIVPSVRARTKKKNPASERLATKLGYDHESAAV